MGGTDEVEAPEGAPAPKQPGKITDGSKLASLAGQTFSGWIEWVGPKFAFIRSPSIYAKYKEDIFVTKEAMKNLAIGAKVDFVLKISDKGKPESSNVRPQGKVVLVPSGEEHTGVIISIFSDGLTIIRCRTIAEEPRNIYSTSPAPGLRVGDTAVFELAKSSKGDLQAVKARSVYDEAHVKYVGDPVIEDVDELPVPSDDEEVLWDDIDEDLLDIW